MLLCKSGYGQHSPYYKGERIAHRVAWVKVHGTIAKNYCICHKCDNRLCVNVDHLFLGTSQDNMADMVNKGRSLKGSKSKTAKLHEQDVLEIRILLSYNYTQKHIAELYNISHQTISLISRDELWV